MAYGYLTPGYPYQQNYYAQPQTPTPTPSLIWVGSLTEAQMYPVAPNSVVVLWDSSAPAIYLKQADAAGRPTLKIYELIERTDASPATSAPKATGPYATKEDVAEFNAALDALRSDIDAMRSDIYGIAGKRKPIRKNTEEDEG